MQKKIVMAGNYNICNIFLHTQTIKLHSQDYLISKKLKNKEFYFNLNLII